MAVNRLKALSNSPMAPHWKRIGLQNHHGFVVPLFCLRSENSCGIGEYPDLIPLIQWAKEIGYDTIQLLPLNDTGIYPSPYSAITAFGLNPLHLGLESLPNVKRYPKLRAQIKELKASCKTQRINYRDLIPRRELFLRQYYELEQHHLVGTAEFQKFQEQNPWIHGYAVFKTLKEIHHWSPHEQWEPELQRPSPDLIEALTKRYKEETNYHIFVQYYCFKQMHQVKEAAERLGSHLLGDIPILIGRESSDIWQWHTLFKHDFNAGVPPDIFAKDGQNWNLPIYNWKAMADDNYRWWKLRLQMNSLFYDMFRIDHILGFYRIWAIPRQLRGRKGFYTPATPREWTKQGETIIKMILNSTEMFPVGEDLGFTPPNVQRSMKKMGVPGWRVIIWERDWDHDAAFIPFDKYSPASVTTLSTHDTATLAEWWIKNKKDAQELAAYLDLKYATPLSTERRLDILRASHHTSSLFHINLLQEYLSLFPKYTFKNPEDERVNMPGTVSSYNWSIRYIPWLEEIIENKKLKTYLKEIIAP